MSDVKFSPKEFESADPMAWCPGCGNFGIREAVKLALSELGLKPEQTCFVSGIGPYRSRPASSSPTRVLSSWLKGETATGMRRAATTFFMLCEGIWT